MSCGVAENRNIGAIFGKNIVSYSLLCIVMRVIAAVFKAVARNGKTLGCRGINRAVSYIYKFIVKYFNVTVNVSPILKKVKHSISKIMQNLYKTAKAANSFG